MHFFPLFIILSLFATLPAFARWATEKETGYRVVSEAVSYDVAADGSHVVEATREVEVLKEKDREALGLFRMNFSAHATEFKVLEAYTRNGDRVTKVSSQHIEVKPLASSGPGFDEQRQVTIAFPDVQIGSRVVYRYRRRVKQPSVDDFFALQFPLGWGEALDRFELRIRSELPLYYQVKDPSPGYVHSEAKKSGHHYELTLRLVRPVHRQVIEESDVSVPVEAIPWVAISTAASWREFPKKTPAVYHMTAALSAKLPPLYESIIAVAELEKSDVARINAVTSRLAEAVRYVGDWVPVEGLFHPRPFAVVAETRFGDCKDYSTATVAMLRRLGFTAHAAWVNRGRNWENPPIDLPTANFNHAIVYAEKDGKTYWVDPTNSTSFAHGLFEDIADRPALILDPANLRLQRIPPTKPEEAKSAIRAEVKFGKGKRVTTAGSFHLDGRAALGMTASGLSYEKTQLDYFLTTWLTDAATLLDWELGPYDLRSRIVKEVKVDYRYGSRWNPVRTSAGSGFMVPAPPFLYSFLFRREQRVAALYAGDARQWRRTLEFSGRKILSRNEKPCRVVSPWLDFRRSFLRKGGKLVLAEEVDLKQSLVTTAEIATPAFGKFQDAVADCMQPSVVVFE